MTTTEAEYDLDSSTLSGDLRDAILDRLRGMACAWALMTEGEQRSYAIEINEMCQHLVRQTVNLVSSEGRPTIKARLKKAQRKAGEIEGTVVLAFEDELRHEFFDAVGCPVLISVADVDAYLGERAPAKVDPDEPELPIAAD